MLSINISLVEKTHSMAGYHRG